MNSLPLSTPFTDANFDEAKYLAANPDVKAAVETGDFESGKVHFDLYGRNEKRVMRFENPNLPRTRAQKLDRLRPWLRNDMPVTEKNGKLDYLSDELRIATRIVDTENVSANGYDETMLAVIEEYSDGIILDCGAGRRSVYYDNVLNYEIVDYDSTDILGVGECLPFKDGTFDAVLSVAVLEHVRDPFLCARELARVLKPGGKLLCAVPFLAPYHGYPHHYFNATSQGIRRLFEDSLTVDSVVTPPVGHPAFTLHWILASWLAGLSAEHKDGFLNKTIGDIIAKGPDALAADEAGRLSESAVEELANAFFLQAHKLE